MRWAYHSEDGRPVAFVYRLDHADPKSGEPTKTYRPVSRWPDGWRLKDPPGPWPLYRLPELAEAARVYVCEGEKCADLIRNLGATATTSAHGAKAADKTEWTPLAGKGIILLPDHDPEGEGYIAAVAGKLARLDPRPTLRLLRLPAMWHGSAPVPDKGDIAEWLGDGVPEAWTDVDCRAELDRLAAEIAEPIDPDASSQEGTEGDGPEEDDGRPSVPDEEINDPHRLARF